MTRDTPWHFPALLFAIWVFAWGGAYRYLRHTDFAPSYSDFQIAIWGGLGFLLGYYAFHKSRRELCDTDTPTHPMLGPEGYWRIHLAGFRDLCFVTEAEKSKVPHSNQELGIGRVRALVACREEFPDEGGMVWVWLEIAD